MASLDEELQEHAEEERQRREEFEARQQQDRQQNSPVNQIKNVAEDKAKKLVKKALWKVAAPYLIPVLAVLAGIALVLFVVIAVPVAVCNNSYTDSIATGSAKAVFTASGICSAFKGNGGASGGGGGGASYANNDQAIRNYLVTAPRGITINKADCTFVGQTDCTSLDGMKQTTINEIVSMAQACDTRVNPAGPPDNKCGVVITGGTEAGHAETGTCTHSSGYKFDMSLNNQINAFVRTFTPIGNRGSDSAPQYRAPGGSIYAQEGDHWDVVVGCS